MGDTRIIKKYPNRRLYDTSISKYITLEDILRLVMDHADFIVKDAKSEEDITRSILLQVILDKEESGDPIFTANVLSRLIRLYGDTVQDLASSYLERSLALFAEQQERFNKQVTDTVTKDPLSAITELTQRNLELWRDMQEGFFKASNMHPKEKDDESCASEKAKDKT